MKLIVPQRDVHRHIEVGESVIFGRVGADNDVPICDDQRVSGRHGIVQRHSESWSVTSTGSTAGFIIFDAQTPSKLVIPKGAGPVIVPFGQAVVSVQVGGDAFDFMIEAEPAPGWAFAWAHADQRAKGTRPAWNTAHWFNPRTNKTLQWYRLLVALCEPRLSSPPTDLLPTNDELARRLNVKRATVDKNFQRLYRELNLGNTYDPRTRHSAVTVALHERIVTPGDLAVLDILADSADVDD